MSDVTNPFSFANEYRKAGWLGTLPLPLGKKHPPPEGYTGGGRPYPDDVQIKRWQSGKHNLALRLAEVPGYVPAGSPPRGYELLGLDVDDYKDKHGAAQLTELEELYGKLPPTLRSSSRWESGELSCIYLFYVPAGYRYLGKAAKAIEVIQKRHRYMVVYPSTNPDAENATYRWKAKDGAYRDVPNLDDVAVLPHNWFVYLSCGGMPESDDPISDMDPNELIDWARTMYNDADGDPCSFVKRQLDKHIEKIEIGRAHV